MPLTFTVPSALQVTGPLTVSGATTLSATTSALARVDASGVVSTTTLQSNFSLAAGTLSLAAALTSINSITSAAGQNLVLAVGTGGTGLTITSSTLLATFTGVLAVSSTEDASTADGTTGAVRTLGGLSVAKKGFFGGTLSVTGKAYFYDSAYVAGSLGVGVAENTQYGINVASGSAMSARLVPTFGTQTSGFGIYSAPTVSSGQTITNLYHLGILNATASGATITNQYGLYLTDLTAGANNYAIYAGAGLVRFGDTLILDKASNALRITNSQTPASATATGTAGTICWDASFLYVCTVTDTWRRISVGAGGW